MTIQNILRTIRQSTAKPVQAAVKGNLPKWLNGSLFRNGPGRFEFENKYYNHLFDGAACVNKFEIKDGNVFFSNKLLETVFYKESLKANGIIGQFGTISAKSNVFSRLKNIFTYPASRTSNTNVTIYPYANKHMYAMTELNYINRIDPEDLSVMSSTNIQEYFEVKTNIAHPHSLRDGSWINVGLNIDGKRKGK
jgi:carotenoid cleavage dioxygenase-like enzyme